MRHAADLGDIPIVVADACGSGDAAAGERTRAGLAFAGDALQTTTGAMVELFQRFKTDRSWLTGTRREKR